MKLAAVLLGILDNKLILTKRAANLRSFTGHICLPGGKFDDGDESIVTTAMREFQEEVYFTGSIEPDFCMLPEYSLVSSHVVYPIIARLDGEISGVNVAEVDKLIYLDIDELRNKQFIIHPNYPLIKHNRCFIHDDELVWGLTAHILFTYTQNYIDYFRRDI